MDVRPPLMAHRQATKIVQPGERALDDPSKPTELRRRFDAAPSDAGHDASNATRSPTSPVVVRFVRMKLRWSSASASSSLPNRPDGVENLVQRDRVVLVGRREHRWRQRTPFRSTIRWCLEPSLPRSVGLRPVFLRRPWRARRWRRPKPAISRYGPAARVDPARRAERDPIRRLSANHVGGASRSSRSRSPFLEAGIPIGCRS